MTNYNYIGNRLVNTTGIRFIFCEKKQQHICVTRYSHEYASGSTSSLHLFFYCLIPKLIIIYSVVSTSA